MKKSQAHKHDREYSVHVELALTAVVFCGVSFGFVADLPKQMGILDRVRQMLCNRICQAY